MSSTAEYRTLTALHIQVTRAVQFDLTNVGGTLYGRGIIPSDVEAYVRNRNYEESNRAAHLVRVVQEKVKEDHKHYYTFVSVLKEADPKYFADILNKLDETKKKIEDDQSAQGHATINDSTSESGHNHSHLVKRLVKSEDGVTADAGAKIKLTRQGSHSSSWANVSVLPTGCVLVLAIILVSILVALAVYYYSQT